jgi:hypothetical protein
LKKLPLEYLKVLILAAVLAVVSARSPPMNPAVYPTYDAFTPVYATPAPEASYNI